MALRAALTDNLVLKATSVLLAVGAWFLAQGARTLHQTIEAPVEYLMPEPDQDGRRLILMNDDPLPDPVRLQVSGSRAAVGRLVEQTRKKEITYVVDLREVEPGRTVHSFLRPPGGVGAEVQIDTVSPAEVEMVFDPVVSETVPVQLRTSGHLPTGFVEKGLEILPTEVKLVGSRSDLAGIEVVETMPLRLDRLTRDHDGTVALDVARLHLLPESPAQVRVRVSVEEASATREYAGIAVIPGAGLEGLEVVPSTCVITLEGPVPVLEALAGEGLRARADGDPGLLAFPDMGPALIRYTAEPLDAGAAPAVRVTIDHSRAAEVQLRSVDPLTFKVGRPGAMGTPAPAPREPEPEPEATPAEPEEGGQPEP